MTAPTPEMLGSWSDHPFWRSMGVVIDHVAGERSGVSLHVQPHHRGGGGTNAVNGGVVAYLCDAAAGAAVAGRHWPPHQVTVSLQMTYLAPVVGDRIRAESISTPLGRTLMLVDTDVLGDDGRVAAKARTVVRVFTRELDDPPGSHTQHGAENGSQR